MILPYHMFETKTLTLKDMKSSWVKPVLSEMNRAHHSSGWNPKFLKLEGDLHMVNLSTERMDGYYKPWRIATLSSIDVIEYVDHPFLKELEGMDHVPKLVKSLYKKEVRLAHLRGDGALSHVLKAEEAWDKYLLNIK